MASLIEDLQQKKRSLEEFIELASRTLHYLPAVLSNFETKGSYKISSSDAQGNIKYVRPVNIELFIDDPQRFAQSIPLFKELIERIKNRQGPFTNEEKAFLDSFIYTIQQSIGVGLDLLVDPNSSRKHVGNRFEELIKALFTEIGVPNRRLVLKIPYETDEGEKKYKCENDLILSRDESLLKSKTIDESEIVVSAKTTSKDRMSKMFIDKILLQKFTERKIRMIGIFLNDVQRKKNNNIGYTLVSGLFMVYNKFLTEMEGVYYLDRPPLAKKPPFTRYIKPFSDLLTEDIYELLSS